MRASALSAVLTLILCPTLASAGGLNLPDLGSKRRVVMAEMRTAGASLLDGSGERLDFIGGPSGLPEASTSSFSFDNNLELDGANVLFPRVNSRTQISRRFRQLQNRVTQTCGKPDRGKGLVATWGCKDARIELRADAHGDTELTVSRRRYQSEQPAAQSSGASHDATDDVAVWSPGFFRERTTKTKRAVENLLHDLGRQKFVRWGYRQKGSPLSLRLNHVEVPRGLDGVDGDLLRVRFLYFVRGNWDVDVAKNRRRSDIDLDMRVVTTRSGHAVQLTARAARGKAKGKVLYSRAHPLML